MRLTLLSLYSAIWLTSTTFALVARPSNLQARVDTTPGFPEGYNAQTCPLARSSVALAASPAKSAAFPPPAWPAAAPKAAMTRRVLPRAPPAPACQLIGRYIFTGDDYRFSYDGRTLEVITTLWMPPGMYVATVVGDGRVRGISLAKHYPDPSFPPGQLEVVRDNPTTSLRVGFSLRTTATVLFRITFYGPGVSGEINLFHTAVSGLQAAFERAGLDAG